METLHESISTLVRYPKTCFREEKDSLACVILTLTDHASSSRRDVEVASVFSLLSQQVSKKDFFASSSEGARSPLLGENVVLTH